MTIEIRPVRADEWQALRALRIRALTEDETAFGSTVAEARKRGDDDWKRYADDGPESITFVAVRSGQFVGMSRGRLLEKDAGLFGMWVAPEARRTGTGRRLVNSVVEWARPRGVPRIVLDVGEHREPARALYASCGFVETGKRMELEAHPGVMEREMAYVFGTR